MPKASSSSAAAGQPPAPKSSDLPQSYEAALKALETLVAELESGQMPLDQLLSSYQRGAALLEFCRGRLDSVEQQVSVLDQGLLKAWTPE